MKKSTRLAVCLLTAAMIALPALTGCTSNNNTGNASSGSTASAGTQESIKYDYVITLKSAESISNEQNTEINGILAKRMTAYGYTNHKITSTEDTFTISYNSKTGDEDPVETANKLIKKGYVVFRGGENSDGETLLDSSDINSAEAYLDESAGTKQYVVKVVFNDEGKEKFRAATEKYMGDHISVWVDEQLISSPVVNSVINDGEAIISSGSPFTEEEAGRLAGNISGVLPTELTVESADKTE